MATVTNAGVITALTSGTTIITCAATDGSGVKATCTVTVTDGVTPAPTSIVGTWISQEMTAQFNSNGTGYIVETGDAIKSDDYFTYSLDTTNKRITLIYSNGTRTLDYVLSSDGNTLTIYGLDDDDLAVVRFTKQGSSSTPTATSISGTWTSTQGLSAQFYSNGTGYIVETGDAVKSSDYFTYSLDSTNKRITLIYSNGTRTLDYVLSSDGNTLTIYGLDDNDLAMVRFIRQ